MHRLIWKKHRADFAFAVLAVLAVLLLVAKCRYGFGYYDESFYLTTAQRFWQGDAPVAQEWNLAQFFALFTAPLVGLVEWLQGGTDGIILTFRYLYVAAQALAAVFFTGACAAWPLWGQRWRRSPFCCLRRTTSARCPIILWEFSS